MKRIISKMKYEIGRRMIEYKESYEVAVNYCYKHSSAFGYKDFALWMLPSKEEMIEIVRDWNNITVENRAEVIYGIYGIYINEDLVYIGKTTNDFSKRFSNYKSDMKKKPNRKIIQLLVEASQEGKRIEFRQIISSKNLPMSNNDLILLEKQLIELYQPIGNELGVSY